MQNIMSKEEIKRELAILSNIYAGLCNPQCHIDLTTLDQELLAKKKEEVYHQLAFLQHMLKYSVNGNNN